MPTSLASDRTRRAVSYARLKGRRRCKVWLNDRLLDVPAWLQNALGYSASGSMVVDHIGQFPFEYDYLSEIGSRLFFDGEFEENEIRFFEKRITQHPAPVILDIGANVGLHSVRWAMTSPRAKVYAFEPSYATYQILARNILRAGLQGRVEAFQQAVSDHVGVAQFYECADNAYSSLKDTGRKAV